jgi:HAD superfamily hydrolase (TIGR01549 family)
MIRAVVLDFDGVILDSVGIKTKAFARLFEDKGPAVVQQVVDYHLANGGMSRFRKFAHIYTNILGEALSETESQRIGEHFSSLVFDEVVKAEWVPGARDFLKENYGRYALFVASGTPQEELERIIQLRKIDKMFAGVFGSPATKEEIIRCVLVEHRLKNSEVVFIGDAMTDFCAAGTSKVNFVGIAGGSVSPFPLGTVVLPDLTRLAALLAGVT